LFAHHANVIPCSGGALLQLQHWRRLLREMHGISLMLQLACYCCWCCCLLVLHLLLHYCVQAQPPHLIQWHLLPSASEEKKTSENR
jgi:hypothetical protein